MGAFYHQLLFPCPHTERIFCDFKWSCKNTWLRAQQFKNPNQSTSTENPRDIRSLISHIIMFVDSFGGRNGPNLLKNLDGLIHLPHSIADTTMGGNHLFQHKIHFS